MTCKRKRRTTTVPDKRWPKSVKRRPMISLLSLVARKFFYLKFMSQTT